MWERISSLTDIISNPLSINAVISTGSASICTELSRYNMIFFGVNVCEKILSKQICNVFIRFEYDAKLTIKLPFITCPPCKY